MTEIQSYRCPKCQNDSYDVGEMRAAGGFWSKIFDVQGSRYSAVTCRQCRYTEFFKTPTGKLGNVFDFITQ